LGRGDRARLLRGPPGEHRGHAVAADRGRCAALRAPDRRLHVRRAAAPAPRDDVRDDQAVSARLEPAALLLMALGVATMLQPWWDGGMRAGFFVALAATIGQIVLSHLPRRPRT